MSLTVLITGASRGLGKLMATTLLEHGHVPVATMRNVAGKNKASANALRDQGIHVVELDVTVDESVSTGVRQALDRFGKVDVLINNAGVVVNGPLETLTAADLSRVVQVNLLGVQRMNRALLPHFREQQAGLIVYMSGLTGRFPARFVGSRNCSDFAMEALAETYHREISSFGIETVILQPEFFPHLDGNDTWDDVGSDTERLVPYIDALRQFEQQVKVLHEIATRPDAPTARIVTEKIVELIELPRGQRPLRATVSGTLHLTSHADRLNETYDEHLAEFNAQLEHMTRAHDPST